VISLKKREKEGIIFIIITIFIAGTLPIVVKYGVNFIHPLFFATFSSLIAGIFLLALAILNGSCKIIFNNRYFLQLILIGFFGISLSNICFFFGVSLTSGINSSILLQIEPIYALFIGYILLNEKISLKQIFFTFVIILGTFIALCRTKFSLNWGDLLVLLTPFCWQISHFFSKRLMSAYEEITPKLIATARTLFGGIFLLIISSLKSTNQYDRLGIKRVLLILLFQGVIGFALQYSLLYEGIKRLNLSKATALLSVYPTVSILLVWSILKEIPNFYQISGFIVIMLGIYGLVGIDSEHREKAICK